MSAPRSRPSIVVRRGILAGDREELARLLAATGFFNDEELQVALELVDDRLLHGEASHYRFLVGEVAGRVAGYACWGPIPGTQASVDLYWIAVDPELQGIGLGRTLLAEAEAWVAAEGRTRIYIETSSRGQYHSTRGFYLACGYEIVAELPEFYAPGDGKLIYLRVIDSDH